ncbi:hypothetical protein [Ancylobacter sp. SL191]|uniref:hypothetical protein n=1 Tax=Ancylobacter sp. SL191 TaxID=2995166 RepID=UPI0022708B87|nr:hypothetical protein [Ancylobacter sp. SL191]WAC27098.1 hypothetical protein OU996_19190 [Ancylobacter sp. SL191]
MAAIVAGILRHIDHHIEAIHETWMPAVSLLAEMDSHAARLRLAETYRALAPSYDERALAESLAAQRRQELLALFEQYRQLPELARDPVMTEMVGERLTRFLQAHDDWMKSPPREFDAQARVSGALHDLFVELDGAILGVIDKAHRHASEEALNADNEIDAALLTLTLLALGAAVTAAIWYGRLKRRH